LEHFVSNFYQLGLADSLLRAVRAEGYETATPIQLQAIPPVLAGRDLMGCAQTGTGKTAAFALPTLHRLSTSYSPGATNGESWPKSTGGASGTRQASTGEASGTQRGASGAQKRQGKRDRFPRADRRPIRSLILAPTRELAAQIGESFKTYGKFCGLRYTVVYGGVGQNPQVKALQNGVDILVATPGRLLDLMEQGHINLRNVEILILDEADQMLDMGFIVPLRKIVAAVPRERQTLMFSATMPAEIRKLAAEWLTDPTHIQVAPVATPAELVEHSVYMVDQRYKPQLLAHYLKNTAISRAIVFARTKHGADKIVKQLCRDGIRAAAIHGNKSQSVRQRTLEAFKSNKPPVLVATDIAARGLDVQGISHVINYELPEVPEVYVHRIGRTGRAGATGIATSFCGGHERDQLRQIERLTRQTLRVEKDQPQYERVAAKPAGGAHVHGKSPARNGGGRPRQGNASNSPRPKQNVAFAAGGAAPAKRRRKRNHRQRPAAVAR